MRNRWIGCNSATWLSMTGPKPSFTCSISITTSYERYWLPFEADHASHIFQPGTRFSDVLNLYVFDRELRLLVLDAIERVEVSARSQWAYQLAHKHGPRAHLDGALAFKPYLWQINLAQADR